MIRNMTCCVCGSAAGRWAQHWNRDTGFGICSKCVEWQHDLMPQHDDQWASIKGIEPMPHPLVPMPPQTARYAFLDRYFELTRTGEVFNV